MKGLVYAIGFVIILGFLSFLGMLSVPVLMFYFLYRLTSDLINKERRKKFKTIKGWVVE
jgi:hypothetical protein